jgi:hypothetical protein
MPKRGTDENEDKQMKPKQIAKIVLDIYDNGYCDRDLFEFYTNDETKKRKKLMHDKSSDFMKLFKETISEQPEYFVVVELLKALDVNPKDFAALVNKYYKDGNATPSIVQKAEEPEEA